MPGEDRITLQRQKPQHSREQKAALSIVISFGSLALIFGSFYLWKHIASPFAITYSGPRFLTGDEKEAEEARKAKQSDTDKDGVNDYDELYVYKSSPYLSDSDSDGLSDLSEITSGEDPNCATGAACETVVKEESDIEDTFLGDVADTYRDSADGAPTAEVQATQAIQAIQNMTPDQMRQLLLEAGANQEAVAALSDEQLKAYFTAALQTATAETSDSSAGETQEIPQ